MWIDLFVCTPVSLFMLWLYMYSSPPERPRWLYRLDFVWIVLAMVLVVGILLIGHWTIDFEGMGLNVMLVAAAYLSLLTVLGTGWLVRYQFQRLSNRQS